MKIKVKVHANSSQEKLEKIDEGNYEVWLKEKAVDGKANIELIKILKKYFGSTARCTPKSECRGKVEIKSGFMSRRKVVEVEN